ncbi:MAG: sigma-70 family RNA polymerase sigma factor [Spirochaetia bacterium]|nr:sigma-70 family RNA polymerase sigma factor [Spirochaetia bacterium]
MKPDIDELYRDQKGRLLAWLSGKSGPDDAEDILQDAFLRACANMNALEPIRDLAGWLWRVAANGLRDLWREAAVRRQKHVHGGELDMLADSLYPGPQTEAELAEQRRLLAAALAALPPEQRLVVDAVYGGDLSLKDIARREGVSIDTIASRKRYALEKLRKALDSDPRAC